MGAWEHITNFAARLRNDSYSLKTTFEGLLAVTPFNYQKRKAVAARIGLAHRLVWVVPQDALAKGWCTNSDSGKDISRKEDDYFEIETKLLYAYGCARQNGGGWLWVVTGEDDEEEPLIPGSSKILAIHDLTMGEVTAFSMQSDPRSDQWGEPDFWTIAVSRNGMSFQASKVHHSRLIYIPGAPVTRDTVKEKIGYDLSYLNLYLCIIEDIQAGWSSTGDLVNRLSMPWIRLKNGLGITSAETNEMQAEAESMAAKMTLLKENMGKNGLMVLLGEDEIGWTGPTVGGVKEVISTIYERIASVEGIPLSRLFGQAPGGLSTDDAAGARSYADLIERERRTKLSPALLRLYEMIYGEDNSRQIVWPKLEHLTALEVVQAELLSAQKDQLLFSMGMLDTGDTFGEIEESEIGTEAISGEY